MNEDLLEDLLESHEESEQVATITNKERISTCISSHYGKIICFSVGCFLCIALGISAYFTYWYKV